MTLKGFLGEASRNKSSFHYEVVTLQNGDVIGIEVLKSKIKATLLKERTKYTISKKGR